MACHPNQNVSSINARVSVFFHCDSPHCLKKTKIKGSVHRFKSRKEMVLSFLSQLLEVQASHPEIKVMCPGKTTMLQVSSGHEEQRPLPASLSSSSSLMQLSNMPLHSNDISSSHTALLTHTEHLMSTLLRIRYVPKLPINIYLLYLQMKRPELTYTILRENFHTKSFPSRKVLKKIFPEVKNA